MNPTVSAGTGSLRYGGVRFNGTFFLERRGVIKINSDRGSDRQNAAIRTPGNLIQGTFSPACQLGHPVGLS